MTVTYTSEVASSKWLGCFIKLLFRWRGSVYKLLWLDIIIYLCMYYSVNFVYRFALDDVSKRQFENVVHYCGKYANLIPLSFVLGFFVDLVATRWWSQYCSIPSPDNLAILVGSVMKGGHETARMTRRTILRYVCLSFTMTLSMISPKVKKRFPELNNFVEAGLLLPNEKAIFDELDEDEYPSSAQYWLPLAWASKMVVNSRDDGLLRSDVAVKSITDELDKFRISCGTLLDYDWISVPLVYTQVVTLAVYSYFVTTLISRQTLEVNREDVVDLIFPIFTILEYFFYVGWLKVAECMINPFGEDDDDFEVMWLVDRHVQMAYTIVDRVQNNIPPLQKDKYWNRIAPYRLPTTSIAKKYMQECPLESTRNIKVKNREMFEMDAQEMRKLQRSRSLNRPASLGAKYRKSSTNENTVELGKPLLTFGSEPALNVMQKILESDEERMLPFNKLKEERIKEHKEKFKKVLELINNGPVSRKKNV